jgi:Geranylgeranyl pyrophosphate synthase
MSISKQIELKLEQVLSNICNKAEPQELYAPIKYMISIGGKRLRPNMSLTTYSLFSENINDSILYPAAALEIFHEFTLIHDDIMDNAPLRRGYPTVYKKWDGNLAILSGDVMCIKSYELLSYCPKDKIDSIFSLFTKTAIKVCEGQQYDINFESRSNITLNDYIKMIGLKTAVLIACSAKIGAIIAGAKDDLCEALYDYGYHLGLAFQIQDDYLDTFGDSSTFGKTIGGDIANNKKTWLLIECFNRLKEPGKEKELNLLEKYLNNPISQEEKFEKNQRSIY